MPPVTIRQTVGPHHFGVAFAKGPPSEVRLLMHKVSHFANSPAHSPSNPELSHHS